jgi:hypothetical protein
VGTLGIESRASRKLSGRDTAAPRALSELASSWQGGEERGCSALAPPVV